MNAKLLAAPPAQSMHSEARMPIHSNYPIAQAFRSNDPVVQEQLMQHAWHATIEREQALVLSDYNGLRALGRNESALNRVAGTLRRRFGAALIAGPPEVRYCDGDPMLEPYMVVLVYGPAIHLTRIRNDLLARRGRVVRVVDRSMFVLEGEAPLADLLGYDERVREILAEDGHQSHVATWLSRYVPIHGNDPEAA